MFGIESALIVIVSLAQSMSDLGTTINMDSFFHLSTLADFIFNARLGNSLFDFNTVTHVLLLSMENKNLLAMSGIGYVIQYVGNNLWIAYSAGGLVITVTATCLAGAKKEVSEKLNDLKDN